jgi:hypothetical protein
MYNNIKFLSGEWNETGINDWSCLTLPHHRSPSHFVSGHSSCFIRGQTKGFKFLRHGPDAPGVLGPTTFAQFFSQHCSFGPKWNWFVLVKIISAGKNNCAIWGDVYSGGTSISCLYMVLLSAVFCRKLSPCQGNSSKIVCVSSMFGELRCYVILYS